MIKLPSQKQMKMHFLQRKNNQRREKASFLQIIAVSAFVVIGCVTFIQNNDDSFFRRNENRLRASNNNSFHDNDSLDMPPRDLIRENNDDHRQLANHLEPTIPTPEQGMVDLDLSSFGDGTVTLLMDLAPPDEVVILAKRNSATDYIPVSRSYDGNDWEASPGLHEGLTVVCVGDNSSRKCQLEIEKTATECRGAHVGHLRGTRKFHLDDEIKESNQKINVINIQHIYDSGTYILSLRSFNILYIT